MGVHIPRGGDVTGQDTERAPRGHGVARVQHEVADQILDLTAVTLARPPAACFATIRR